LWLLFQPTALTSAAYQQQYTPATDFNGYQQQNAPATDFNGYGKHLAFSFQQQQAQQQRHLPAGDEMSTEL
jgi:hypothetical protein